MSWYLVSYAIGPAYCRELRAMEDSCLAFNRHVELRTRFWPQPMEWGQATNMKPIVLRDHWGGIGDMVWVDADARFRRKVEPPEGEFDVAGKIYNAPIISTGTLWFRNSFGRVPALLDRWSEIAHTGQKDEDTFWKAVRDTGATYQELPDSLTAVCSRTIRGYGKEPVPDPAILHWNVSRRVLGHLDDWPPTEEERRNV